MKKIIKILQTDVEPLIIEDEDDSNLDDYMVKLSELLNIGNVVILETTTSSHIIRPNQIISISVNETGRKRNYKKAKNTKNIKKEKPPEKEQEDIITDG